MSAHRSRFAVNTYSYTLSHDAADCVRHLAGQGVRAFELMGTPGHLWPSEMDQGGRSALRGIFEAEGLRLIALNMPSLDINFAAASPEMRRYTMELMRGLVILAGDLGAEYVLVTPGKANPLYPPPRERLVERFYAALDELHPLARSVGTRLIVENIPICFAPDAPGLLKLVEEYGRDDIHIVYDIANAYFIGEDLGEGLRAVRSRLKLVHLSDTGRGAWKHDPVGDGTVPFAQLPALLAEVGYRDLPVLEIISPHGDSGVLGSIDRLSEMGWS